MGSKGPCSLSSAMLQALQLQQLHGALMFQYCGHTVSRALQNNIPLNAQNKPQ